MNDLIDGWHAREKHIKGIGYVRPTVELCQFLAKQCPWIEIGAGTGALAAGIHRAGGACIATDDFSWQKHWSKTTDVMQATALEAAGWLSREDRKYFGLLCSWPSYSDSWCFQAVSLLKPGQLFGYIGEGSGGCTGDEQLHNLLESDFEVVADHPTERFYGIYDHCWIYRRKS